MLKEGMAQGVMRHAEGRGDPIPVLIYVEPGRMELPDRESSIEILRNSVRTGVANGMRASLGTGSILTGAKFVSIDYFKGTEPASMGKFLEYPTIPTIETGLDQIEQKLNAVLEKINSLPLEDTVSDANSALATLNETLAGLNKVLENQSTQQLPEQIDQTLQDLQGTLESVSPDSEVYQSIQSSLLRLNRTLGNMESLTRTLSGQPNAAILPSSPVPDPIPEVRQ